MALKASRTLLPLAGRPRLGRIRLRRLRRRQRYRRRSVAQRAARLERDERVAQLRLDLALVLVIVVLQPRQRRRRSSTPSAAARSRLDGDAEGVGSVVVAPSPRVEVLRVRLARPLAAHRTRPHHLRGPIRDPPAQNTSQLATRERPRRGACAINDGAEHQSGKSGRHARETLLVRKRGRVRWRTSTILGLSRCARPQRAAPKSVTSAEGATRLRVSTGDRHSRAP